MILIPFVLALLMGVILFVHWNGYNPLRDGISFVVAWLLGAGFFVIITFGHVSIFNGYHAFSLACTVWLSVAIAGFYGFRKYRVILMQFPRLPRLRPFHFAVLLILVIALILMMGMAKQYPYGDWNAWSFWNFRTKFIMLSSGHWKEIYSQTVQAKHPWFLPYWLIFCCAMGSMDFNLIPLINSIVFGLLVLAVVMAGVFEQTSNRYAVIAAGFWLATIPNFVYHSIGQSADVTMALMIVVNVAWLLRFIDSPDQGKALTLGMLLGMMAFTKDEGIVSMVIILIILFNGKKDILRWIPCLLRTLIPWLVFLLIVKMWMWGGTSGENQIQWNHLWDFNRLGFLIVYFLNKGCKYYLIVSFFLINLLFYYLSSKTLEEKTKVMINFLSLFIFSFFLLYLLVKSNLTWRLNATQSRLIYEIYGVEIMLTCSLFFNRRNKEF